MHARSFDADILGTAILVSAFYSDVISVVGTIAGTIVAASAMCICHRCVNI
jgi:uncharacterized protein (DUF697 family)